MDVNASGGSSNLNGVFEPGEIVLVEPQWAGFFLDWNFATSASSFAGPPTATYTIVDGAAAYSLSNSTEYCDDCFVMSIDDPVIRPAVHWDTTFFENSPFGGVTWTLHIGRSFSDVPITDPFYVSIETILHQGVTSGCGGGDYCPTAPVTRSQMAVFLLKAKLGIQYTPPAATGSVFDDVPAGSFAADWIEDLHNDGVTDGCQDAPPLYCPSAPVTRAQMAVFLLKTKNGAAYTPPACAGVFGDVECTPTPAFAVDWIEELYNEGITGGCGGGNYCPDSPNTRGQMAVFLMKTFALTGAQ